MQTYYFTTLFLFPFIYLFIFLVIVLLLPFFVFVFLTAVVLTVQADLVLCFSGSTVRLSLTHTHHEVLGGVAYLRPLAVRHIRSDGRHGWHG